MSQQLDYVLLHDETAPKSAVVKVNAANSVIASDCILYSADDIRLLLCLALTRVHTDPSVPELFNVVRISLAVVENQLLTYVVAKLHSSVVLALQIRKLFLSELTETHLD